MRKITKRQKQYILDLLSRLEPEKVVKISKQYNLDNINKLSSKEASIVIQTLLQMFVGGVKKWKSF